MKLIDELSDLLDESQQWQKSIESDNFESLLPELAEHAKTLKSCIYSIEQNQVTQSHLDKLSSILEQHKASIELINQRKQQISGKLLGLRNGRNLTQTYNPVT